MRRLKLTIRKKLERDFRGELNAARTASTEERIADPHIACRRECVEADAASRRVETVDARIGDKVGQHRIRKIRVVKQVEEFRAELQLHSLGELCVFEHREVEFLE